MSARPGIARVLHLHGSLAADDPQARRCVRLMAMLDGRLRHTVVAGDGDYSALSALPKGVAVERRDDFPRLGGVPLPGRLQRIARAMVDHHLVLTYGRGAIGAALAHTAFSQVHALPPLIHHEDGSDETAAQRRGFASTWLRRLGLGKAAGLVVPTETMERAALIDWQQPIGRVKRIADGVDVAALAKPRKGEAIPRLLKRPGEHWIGCEARFDGSDAPELLLPALPMLHRSWHLVIAGDGPRRADFLAQVAAASLDDRVHTVPALEDCDTLARLADIAVFVGGRVPLPRLAMATLAAGKPLVGFDGPEGEIAASASPANADFLGPAGEADGLAAALAVLTDNGDLRADVGTANQAKARAERDESAMIAAYRRLYDSAIDRGTR